MYFIQLNIWIFWQFLLKYRRDVLILFKPDLTGSASDWMETAATVVKNEIQRNLSVSVCVCVHVI